MMVEVINGKVNEAFFTGLISAVSALGGLLSGVAIGHISDRIAPFKLLLPLLGICAVTTILQAVSQNIYFFMVMRFFAFFTAGGLYPVILLIMSRNTNPELKGTFFGLSSSINTAGGVLCAMISASIVYFLSVRGIWVAATGLFLLMIPMSVFTMAAIRKSNPVNP
jgi:DHA1 family multidrug resistance protein-like MFS transporter